MALRGRFANEMSATDAAMAPRRVTIKIVGASIALLGLLGVGIWYRINPFFEAESPRGLVRLPLDSEENTSEPLSAIEVGALEVVVQPQGEGTGISAPVLRTKAETLSKALAQRPPELVDPRTERFDPDRQHRYAARAARAERLNQRLSQHIEALEARLAVASSSEQSAIEAELLQLRANLAKRRGLEREAIPTPPTRAGS